jgi:hypothetical protein
MTEDKKSRLADKKAQQKQLDDNLRTVDDDINDSMSQGKLRDKKARRRKLYIKIGGGIGLAVFLWWVYIALFTYGKGSTAYGICKVFLEQQVQYPVELKVTSIQNFSQMVRIWYVQHDSFGQVRFEMMDCYFKKDGSGLEKVAVNRRQLDASLVESFNKSISAVLAYPPDLTYPPGLPDSIKELKKSTLK